jgi:hypothetical protein
MIIFVITYLAGIAGGLGGGSGAGGFPTLFTVLENCECTFCVIGKLLAGYWVQFEFSSQLFIIPMHESKEDDLIRTLLAEVIGTGFGFCT